jgi:small subunit ribosomal protein S4
MSRYTGPKNRLSRREGVDLFGRGHKLRRATVPPGQHGATNRRRPSNFGIQLREKQKVKRTYGVNERQFHHYYVLAASNRGATGESLLKLLETRLDNVVYRLGFFPTRAMSRQIIGHGHIKVNNRSIDVPSFQVKVGDQITLSSKIGSSNSVVTRLQNSAIIPPSWLTREATNGKVLNLPNRSDIDSNINEQLIVEFYSR